MAFAYCRDCESELSNPTNEEIIDGEIICDCGCSYGVDEDYYKDLMKELLLRVKRLEGRSEEAITYMLRKG